MHTFLNADCKLQTVVRRKVTQMWAGPGLQTSTHTNERKMHGRSHIHFPLGGENKHPSCIDRATAMLISAIRAEMKERVCVCERGGGAESWDKE